MDEDRLALLERDFLLFQTWVMTVEALLEKTEDADIYWTPEREQDFRQMVVNYESFSMAVWNFEQSSTMASDGRFLQLCEKAEAMGLRIMDIGMTHDADAVLFPPKLVANEQA